jgi:hypothetical protein
LLERHDLVVVENKLLPSPMFVSVSGSRWLHDTWSRWESFRKGVLD